MVKFYEFFFYRVHWYYVEKGKENIGNDVLSCAFGMTFFLGFNYAVIHDTIKYIILDYRYFNINIMQYWIPATIILVSNYWYFSRKQRKERIVTYWKGISKREKRKFDVLLVIYMFISIVLILTTAYMIRNNVKI